MGKMKFGSSSKSPSPFVTESTFEPMSVNDTLLETVRIEYVDRPVEVIKEIEVIKTVEVPIEIIKYVDREVIKEIEKPVIIEKVVLVEAATPPAQVITKEVIVEKEIQIKNKINTILIYIIALSLLANVLQGLL